MEGVLVGYWQNSKAYQCYYPKTKCIVVTRNIVFIESKDNHPYPYRPGVQVGEKGEDDNEGDPFQQLETGIGHGRDDGHTEAEIDIEHHENPPEPVPDKRTIPHKSRRVAKPSTAGAAMRGIPHETLLEKTMREMREKRTPLAGDIANALKDTTPVVTDKEVNEMLGVTEDDPRNYREATQAYDAAEWETRYDNELESMKHHGVWTLIPRSDIPEGRRILGS